LETSKLTISRTSPDDVKQRQVIIKLDGEWIGDLMFGKSLTRTIEPGHHELRFDNTWKKKIEQFDAAPGEHLKFRVVNTTGRFTWALVATLGAGPMYITVEREA
jgi:hypothetical protein